MYNRAFFCALTLGLLLSAFDMAWASQVDAASTLGVMPLWLGPAPLAHGTRDFDVPTITAYLSSAPGLRPAVVIFPGGGYGYLSPYFEGTTFAHWLQQRGVSAFVVQYRLGTNGYQYPAPYLDAQRALRLVRSRASEWHLQPDRIGVVGFSAGGHLAGLLATNADEINTSTADPVDRLSDHPDFAILLYPVVTMEATKPQPASRRNLLGPDPDGPLAKLLSVDQRVTSAMPTTLLMYSRDDPIVPPSPNGDALAAALNRAGVINTVVVFPNGGHGWGLGHKPELGPAHWIDRMEDWLKKQGLVTP